jgi:bla regulator protein BlaR1
MELFLPLAAKSLLIAGATLLLLKLMQRRSAADRSFVAHLGLASIAVLPLALLALPQMEVETGLLGAKAPVEIPVGHAPVVMDKEVVASTATFPQDAGPSFVSTVDWAFWAYAAPAALLLLFTLIALGRLVILKSKSSVLVEPHWLTALARAQRRMGFKHGTALLTSDELKSPISWGLMRPVILLNREAADAHGQAEAIIAHELAHVARLDWVKLLLSRITVALFWFNPFVWLLAREAHQLREEAADDAVLAADIEDTDYANLLVGIARHECRGLLLGAHGVAPARNSLARRVQRVLDVASSRAPGGWRWSAAAAFFAAGMVVPLAVLQFVPTTPVSAANVATVGGKAAPKSAAAAKPVSPVEQAAAAAVSAAEAAVALTENVAGATVLRHSNGATISTDKGKTVLRSPDGGTVTIYPPDSKGRRKTVMRSPDGSIAAYADARTVPGLASAVAIAGHPHDDAIDRAVELKAVGATPEYVAAIRRAAPHLRLDHDDIVELKAVGVSPAYLKDLAGAGLTGLSTDSLVEARALGITGDYVRAMGAAGYGRLPLDRLVELKAVGATPADVARYRRAGKRMPSVHELVKLKAMEIDPEDIDIDIDVDPDVDVDHDPDTDP